MATSLTGTSHQKVTGPLKLMPSGVGSTAVMQVLTTGVELVDATLGISGEGSTIVPCYPAAAQQALSGAGAVTITERYTAWTTTGADAGTMADGAQKGQVKKVQLIVDGGDGTLTPATLTGGTTVTFADAGDFAEFMWDGSSWVVTELGNAADGATAPVLA